MNEYAPRTARGIGYLRRQSLNYRHDWVDEQFSGRLSLDVKAGEDGED